MAGKGPIGKSQSKPDRATRLADELRANLARRKAQARSRKADDKPEQTPGEDKPSEARPSTE
jgi:hypothetical protein